MKCFTHGRGVSLFTGLDYWTGLLDCPLTLNAFIGVISLAGLTGSSSNLNIVIEAVKEVIEAVEAVLEAYNTVTKKLPYH